MCVCTHIYIYVYIYIYTYIQTYRNIHRYTYQICKYLYDYIISYYITYSNIRTYIFEYVPIYSHYMYIYIYDITLHSLPFAALCFHGFLQRQVRAGGVLTAGALLLLIFIIWAPMTLGAGARRLET